MAHRPSALRVTLWGQTAIIYAVGKMHISDFSFSCLDFVMLCVMKTVAFLKSKRSISEERHDTQCRHYLHRPYCSGFIFILTMTRESSRLRPMGVRHRHFYVDEHGYRHSSDPPYTICTRMCSTIAVGMLLPMSLRLFTICERTCSGACRREWRPDAASAGGAAADTTRQPKFSVSA